jgi:hypothetical protein
MCMGKCHGVLRDLGDALKSKPISFGFRYDSRCNRVKAERGSLIPPSGLRTLVYTKLDHFVNFLITKIH